MSSADVAVTEGADGARKIDSLSGNERNHLFLNKAGEEFTDVSLLSGLDSLADGRAFAYFDYDRDGWSDITVVNANSPLTDVYRNQLGEQPKYRNHKMIAVRFVGGNKTNSASTEYTTRDGIGAKVKVSVGDRNMYREHRFGDGFCAQNSNTLVIGIGDVESVDQIEVTWPSGETARIENVEAGSLVTCFEDAEDSSDGSGFQLQDYLRDGSNSVASNPNDDSKRISLPVRSPSQKLNVYTAMATWCPSCKAHLPQVQILRDGLSESEIGIYGIPVDPDDSLENLQKYEAKFNPAYQLIPELTVDQRLSVEGLIEENDLKGVLPSTWVTDSEGRILRAFAGIPTVSQVRQWLDSL